MARQNHRRRQRAGATDWISVSVGIMTIATIIAAATVAATINISRASPDLGAVEKQGAIRTIAAFIAGASLMAYLVAVVTGLATLFRRIPPERERVAKLSAIGLYLQVFAVVLFSFVVIFGPLIAKVEQDSDAECERIERAGHDSDAPGDGRHLSGDCNGIDPLRR